MTKTLILIILPDFKNEQTIINWEKDLHWAQEKFYMNPPFPSTDISIQQRWAIGFIAWKKLLYYFNMIDNVDVYFIRTNYKLDKPFEIDKINNIIDIRYDEKCGHIIYKTLISMQIFKDKYDFIVRGNVNTIIDINFLSKFVNTLPKKKIFTSPFWEGGDYSFGYFILISNDIANDLIENGMTHRWITEDTADDYELTRVILKKYDYYIIKGCDRPWTSTSHPKEDISTINKCGIRFHGVGQDGEDSQTIINKIKDSNELIFLYRIRQISDQKYFEVYHFLIRHIWNKVVKNMYKSMVIYNENDTKVPHLDYERDEQLLAAKYINGNDVVLELGARYGSVSCIINSILNNKTNQVSVEPDNSVWNALEKNCRINQCSFHIYKGIISKNNYKLKLNGYGSTIDLENKLTNAKSIDTINMSLEDLQNKYNLQFNVLVADCEGFLEKFLDENPILYKQLNKILFECDRPDICNYTKIKDELLNNGFKVHENGFQCVYMK